MNKPVSRRRRRSLKTKLLTLVGIVLTLVALLQALTALAAAANGLLHTVGYL